MNIPSDSSKNIYCPPQGFGTRMVMIPSVRGPTNIFPANCSQPGLNYPINSPIPYRIIRYSTPTQYQQIMNAYGHNLHGNENNTNVKRRKKSLPTEDSKGSASKSPEKTKSEDPIDLSSTNLNVFSSSSKTSIISSKEKETNNEAQKSPENIVLKSPKKEPITPPSSQLEQEPEPEPEPEPEQGSVQDAESYSLARAQRKRKTPYFSEDGLLTECDLEGWVGHVKPVPGIPRQAGSKREEVLKAARSLFSKRTRTLYHWLYPTTSKNKLKQTVAAAWETLSTAEKDFYISQVLGRFGVPAGSLMVNPQLGGFKGPAGPSSSAGASISATGSSGSLVDETGRAVTNLLLSEDDVRWSSYSHAQTQEILPRRRRRQTRNSNGEGSSSRQHQEEEETRILKQIREESAEDDFADDPELSKEFEQFRMLNLESVSNLHLDLDELLNGIL